MEFFNQLYQNLRDTSVWEFIAVITGIGSVWYARKESILVYPVGIISVLIYVFIFYEASLFADAGINLFYFAMSVYGWYHWTHKNGHTAIREISVNTLRDQILAVALTFVAFICIFALIWVFKRDDTAYITSYVPYVDSFVTAIFLIGMWLMALKRVENWIYWIIGDLIALPLCFMKGLVFTSVQYLVFLIIAVLGYLEWKRRWEERHLSA